MADEVIHQNPEADILNDETARNDEIDALIRERDLMKLEPHSAEWNRWWNICILVGLGIPRHILEGKENQ